MTDTLPGPEDYAKLNLDTSTNEELRAWALKLDELRNNLAQAAGTALSVLQDALGTPAATALEEQAQDAEVELVTERAAHGTTTRQLAEARADLESTRQAWAAAVVASMREHPVEDWLPVVVALLPAEIAGRVQRLVAAQALKGTDG
jgi:hypothetical protein